jgi:hypothetical protein
MLEGSRIVELSFRVWIRTSLVILVSPSLDSFVIWEPQDEMKWILADPRIRIPSC